MDPVSPSPLVAQVAERVRGRISSGEWGVGTKLPGEHTLAPLLGVSRPTLREAMRILAGAGLVESRQGAGVFVVATEPRVNWSVQLRRAALTDVYEVRVALEVEAARLAAARRTDGDMTAITAAMDRRVAAAGENDAAFVDADIALHAAIVAAAHNPILANLFTEFLPALRAGLINLVELLDLRAKLPNPGQDTHAALVAAVAAQDPEAAERTLRQELRNTLALLRRD
ncbi:FadR/GntR family transcriptional regulator [Paractinoplanes atraurantiacus]|uniref:DNA-binding transcriptional regulator, FadR family n=1 Tax=Paractinoplanes atraurantiacus TaxID=1036182 RepID=A0A285J2N3_9ACTN|nr:FCD domain-containing protein [Actinoplanes atraurantiacus]SNY54549.1 DNA-binding transcriptional regulator, FadR family [Actinoplanes atraurantiacus]